MTDSENQNRSFFMFVLIKSTLTSECALLEKVNTNIGLALVVGTICALISWEKNQPFGCI